MANTFKNIVITPNIGNTADPKIDFLGGNTTANTTINLYVYPDANGTLSFEGSAGQLFSITNDLANLLFSVADVSGIPSLEVYANGLVSVAPLGGNVVVGAANAGIVANSTGITTSSNTTVNSSITAALLRIANSTGSANLTATSLVIGNTTIQTTNTILGGTIAANGGIGTAGQVLKSGGAGANAYWAADLNSGGTVTSVSSGNGLTGGPITTTGTLSVQAGTDGGLVSNATGVWVLAGGGLVTNSTGLHVGTANGITVAADTVGALVGSTQTLNSTGIHVNNTLSITTLTTTGNITLGAAFSANGSTGTAGFVLKSGGTANAYWAADTDTNTTYDLLAVANTTTNQGIIRLRDSSTANDDVLVTGANGIVVSSNATHIIITDTLAGDITSVTAGDGLTGGGTGGDVTLNVVAANGITVAADSVGVLAGSTQTLNSTGIHVNNTLSITTLTTTGNITLGASLSSNGSFGTAGQILTSGGSGANAYWQTVIIGDITSVTAGDGLTGGGTSGDVTLNVVAANGITVAADSVGVLTGSTQTLNSTGVHVNTNLSITTLTTSGNITLGASLSSNGSFGTAGQILTSGGSGANAYWQSITLGDITAVTAGDGLTGGGTSGDVTLNVVAANGITVAADSVAVTEGVGLAVNTTGVHVKANTGIVANSTGTFVNATYIGTISANNASFLGGTAAASFVQNTDSRTLSGNLLFTGTNTTITTDFRVVNSTANVALFSSNGQLLLGSTTPEPGLPTTSGGILQVLGPGGPNSSIGVFANSDANAPSIRQYRKRATGGTVQAGDSIGAQQFAGWSGTNYRLGARINALIDTGTISDTSMPGYIILETSPDGTVAPVERLRVAANGNVGISNSTPDATLAVTGSANVSGAVRIGGVSTLVGNANLSGTLQTISGNANFDSGVLFVDATNNRVGVNSTAPDAALTVTGTANVSGVSRFAANVTLAGTLQTIAGNSNFDSGVLFVDATNNRVGINNTAPDADLTVAGSANVSGVSRFAANVTLAGALQTISGNANFDSGVLFVDATNNRVGVNSTAPDAALTVTGTANVSGVTTFSANVLLRSLLSANGGFGSAGQVLTSAGTGANTYWATPVGGGYYKGAASAVGTLGSQGQNIFRINANTLNTSTTMAAGENAQATGPLTIASGITLTVQTGARVSIV